MCKELVRELQSCPDAEYGCSRCEFQKTLNCRERLMKKAADAIEELSRRETPMKITEIHVDEYYCPACGAENNCDEGDVQDTYCPACGQRLLPEPPKEEA